MFRRTFTFLFTALFISTFIYGQESNIKTFSKILVDPDYTPTNYIKLNITPPSYRGSIMPIGVTTDYDYFSNSVVRDQIIFFDGVTNFANMVRPWNGNASRRMVAWVTYDGSSFSSPVGVFDDAFNSGWPHIDIATDPDLSGTIGIVGHHTSAPTTPSKLAIWDGSGFLVSQFDPATDPSLQFIGPDIYLATSGNRTQFQFYVTHDLGVSFINFDSISAYHPSPIWYSVNGGVEVGMAKSPNEQYFGYFGTNEGVGHVYNGIAQDSADNLWILNSSDGGTTWPSFAGSVGYDGIINSVSGYHTPNYAPLFENFGQVDAAVDNNGTWHFVANGYGLVFNATHDTAIANAFPLLYWNSNTQQWRSVSDEAIDTIQAIGDFYPTNSIGQAYPSVSLSEDGQVVFVMWTAPQLTSTGELDTANNGAGVTYYWRDLYYTYSIDGGETWTKAVALPDMQSDASEIFGHASQHLEFIAPDMYRAHIVFISDLTTGVGPFDGILTDNPIMYATYDIIATSADDKGGLINNFELVQNYPNPFNPSTQIKYTLAERSNVVLKVYDVLGKEVATLVNASKDAGSHEVKFDASNLSSGLYIYTLQAGNFTSSKKMMLLK